LYWSYSGTVDKQTQTVKSCTRSKPQINEELTLSRSSAYRAQNALEHSNLITKTDRDTYVYNRSRYDNAFIRADKRLFAKDYDLTYSEIIVASYIITHVDDLKRDKINALVTSNSEIADVLDLHTNTVERAISTLLSKHIIIRKRIGKNGYDKSVYNIHRKFQSKRKSERTKKVTTTTENGQKVVVYKNESDINAERKAQREREYYDAKHKAEDVAERNINKARSDAGFKRADEALTALAIDIARAEVNGTATTAMYAREKALQRERAEALKRLGLCDDDLKPRYPWDSGG
jgi:predicted transcriptional regulator